MRVVLNNAQSAGYPKINILDDDDTILEHIDFGYNGEFFPEEDGIVLFNEKKQTVKFIK